MIILALLRAIERVEVHNNEIVEVVPSSLKEDRASLPEWYYSGKLCNGSTETGKEEPTSKAAS